MISNRNLPFLVLTMAHPLIALAFNLYIYEEIDTDIIGLLAFHTALFTFSNDVFNLRHDLRATQLGALVPVRQIKIEFCIKLFLFFTIFVSLFQFKFLSVKIDPMLFAIFLVMIPSTVVTKYFFYFAHQQSKKNYINYEILIRIILYASFMCTTLIFVNEEYFFIFVLMSQVVPYFITSICTSIYLLIVFNTAGLDKNSYSLKTNMLSFTLKNILRNVLSSFLKQADILVIGGAVSLSDLSFYKIVRSIFTAIDSLTFSFTRLNLKFGELAKLKLGSRRIQDTIIFTTPLIIVLSLLLLDVSAPNSLFLIYIEYDTWMLALTLLLAILLNSILQVFLIKQFGTGESGSLILPQFTAILLALPLAYFQSGLNSLFIYLIISYLSPKLFIFCTERWSR